MNGTATVFKKVSQPVLTAALGGSSDPASSLLTNGLMLRNFNDGVTNEIFFDIPVPHEYKEGTSIETAVRWLPTTSPASTENVIWKLDYNWINDTDVLNTVTVTTKSVTAATGTTGLKRILSSLGLITGTGKTINSILHCRFYRDGTNGSDTYTAAAALEEVDFIFECDSLGSETEYGK
jgi:hypothetical protein